MSNRPCVLIIFSGQWERTSFYRGFFFWELKYPILRVKLGKVIRNLMILVSFYFRLTRPNPTIPIVTNCISKYLMWRNVDRKLQRGEVLFTWKKPRKKHLWLPLGSDIFYQLNVVFFPVTCFLSFFLIFSTSYTIVSDFHWVNFTNILQAVFCMKVLCAAFMCLQFGFAIFWQKEIDAKAACKMSVKLATST